MNDEGCNLIGNIYNQNQLAMLRRAQGHDTDSDTTFMSFKLNLHSFNLNIAAARQMLHIVLVLRWAPLCTKCGSARLNFR